MVFKVSHISKALFLICLLSSILLPAMAQGDNATVDAELKTERRARLLLQIAVKELVAPLLREAFPHMPPAQENPYRSQARTLRSQKVIHREIRKLSRAFNRLITGTRLVDTSTQSDKALLTGLSAGGCATAATAFCVSVAHALGLVDLSQMRSTIDVFNAAIFTLGAASTPAVAISAATEIYHDTRHHLLERRLKQLIRHTLVSEGISKKAIAFFEIVLERDVDALSARDSEPMTEPLLQEANNSLQPAQEAEQADAPCPTLLQALPDTNSETHTSSQHQRRVRVDVASEDGTQLSNEDSDDYHFSLLPTAALAGLP